MKACFAHIWNLTVNLSTRCAYWEGSYYCPNFCENIFQHERGIGQYDIYHLISYSLEDSKSNPIPKFSTDFANAFLSYEVFCKQRHLQSVPKATVIKSLRLLFEHKIFPYLGVSDDPSSFISESETILFNLISFYLAIHKLQYTKINIQYICKGKKKIQNKIRYNAKDSPRKP